MDGNPVLWWNPTLHQEVFVRNISSVTALTGLVWEHIITCHHEYHYIWSGSMNRVKILYLFSRYFALFSQIVNVSFIGPLSQLPVSRNHCKTWFLCLIVCCWLLLAAIDLVVMLRVYVLFNRSRRVGYFLAFLMAMQGALVATCTGKWIDRDPFSPTCQAPLTRRGAIFYMSGVLLSQICLLLMTVSKRKVAFGQSPVVDLVVRDGAWTFLLIFCIFAITIPYSFITQIVRPHIVFMWPITLLSVASCRLIINMQEAAIHFIPEHDSTATNTNIAFTSFIDMIDLSSRVTSRITSRATTPGLHTHSRASRLPPTRSLTR